MPTPHVATCPRGTKNPEGSEDSTGVGAGKSILLSATVFMDTLVSELSLALIGNASGKKLYGRAEGILTSRTTVLNGRLRFLSLRIGF
jgi:hypothetical protein